MSKYKRKYLDEQNISWRLVDEDDDRFEEQMLEREVLGFPSYETWNLDASMIYCLYERVKEFLNQADDFVDLNYHKFSFEEKTWTQRELIFELLKECENLFNMDDNWDPNYTKSEQRIWEIWRVISPAMWW